MNDRIAKLQLRIRALHRGHAASQVRYPADLRAEIIAVARAGQTAGGSVYRLAREIGVSAPTLIEWLRRPARGRLRQITVAPAPATTMGAPTNPVLVTPHGFRIEGLDLAGLVTVVPRQNLIRLAQEHRDPSIRRQAHDSEPGWR